MMQFGGEVVSDGMIEAWFNGIIYENFCYGNRAVKIGSGAMLTYIRYCVAKNIVPFDQIEFFYNGEKLDHYRPGKFKKWPNGLDDYMVEWLAGIR